MNDLYLIAEFVSIADDSGYVFINSYSDFPERFNKLNKIFVEIFGEKKEFFVEKAKDINNSLALKLKNFDNPEDVNFLIGKKVYISSKDKIKLPKDTFFIHDLIGSLVYYRSEIIGKIEDVLSLPTNDVYIIKGINGAELLIPAIKSFIENFDVENRTLKLNNNIELFDNEN